MVQPGLNSNSAHALFLYPSVPFSHVEGEVAAQVMLSSAFFQNLSENQAATGEIGFFSQGFSRQLLRKTWTATITRRAFLSTWGNDSQKKCPESELRT